MPTEVRSSVLAVDKYINLPTQENCYGSDSLAPLYISHINKFKKPSIDTLAKDGPLYTENIDAEKRLVALGSLVDKLASYFKLKEEWDGYSAIPPRSGAVSAAIDFSRYLFKNGYALPKPMLSSDGEVGLYWDESGYFVDVGFENSREFSYYAKGEQIEAFGEDDISAKTIPPKLANILRMMSGNSLMQSAA